MSRELPDRPNLEYLKNQAKDRLQDLRRSDANAQLADAQHSVACEYGFASWPKLKAHVEALMQEVPSTVSPFVGSWIANIDKSKRHPASPFRSASLHIAIDRRGIVTLDDVVVDGAGREERQRNVLHTDGREHPVAHGYVLTAAWRGPRLLEVVGRKGTEDEGTVHYELSSDDRTLTIYDRSGQVVCVFDRQ
jgi:hypothetical protein